LLNIEGIFSFLVLFNHSDISLNLFLVIINEESVVYSGFEGECRRVHRSSGFLGPNVSRKELMQSLYLVLVYLNYVTSRSQQLVELDSLCKFFPQQVVERGFILEVFSGGQTIFLQDIPLNDTSSNHVEICLYPKKLENNVGDAGFGTSISSSSDEKDNGSHQRSINTGIISVLIESSIDSVVNENACNNSSSTGFCNLRSAVSYCVTEISNGAVECLITSPPSTVLIIDPSLGEIAVSDLRGKISLQGQGSEIRMNYDPVSSTRLFHLQNSDPGIIFELALLNLTISGFKNNFFGGAISLKGLSTVIMDGVIFRDNMGLYGGGVFMDQCAGVNIQNSRFLESQAVKGGAIFLSTNNLNTIVFNCTFIANIASESGGDIYLEKENFGVILSHNLFTNSSANNYGGSIYLGNDNDYTTILSSIFAGTRAIGGGAIFLNGYNYDLTISNIHFIECMAQSSGGAILANIQNNDMSILDSLFYKCIAGDQGGALHSHQNDGIIVKNCSFSNTRSTYGGALSVYTGKSINIANTTFFLSYASIDGGAIYFDADIYPVVITSCLIHNSTAGGTGGAVYIGYRNQDISFLNVTFMFNEAGDGGGVSILTENRRIEFVFSSFHDNRAREGSGGGVYVSDSIRSLSFSNCLFESNSAALSGGGLSLSSGSTGARIYLCTFRSNTASVTGKLADMHF
jgi:hypothetical protein